MAVISDFTVVLIDICFNILSAPFFHDCFSVIFGTWHYLPWDLHVVYHGGSCKELKNTIHGDLLGDATLLIE